MKLYEILKDFEQSITKSGLPEPPKLSHLVKGKSVTSPTIKEAAELPNSYPDGMTITSNTKPGWYLVGGEKVYINNFDIPGRTPINAGKLRNTIEIKEPVLKWKISEPSPSPIETPKPFYSGHTEVRKISKPIRWQDTLVPGTNIERR